MPDKVLIVDDDASICKLLQKVMGINGLESEFVNSGSKALEKIKTNTYDIILMDIMLGDMEGFDVIKKIRNNGIKTPIMVISGRNEDYDSLYGLSIGADDYVTKPFRPVVLGAKVKALIRRSRDAVTGTPKTMNCGPFKYDPATMKFYKHDKEIYLSSKESAMMLMFIKMPNHVFTKENIHEAVWGEDIAIDDNAIMVYINRLRGKIEDDKQNPVYITTLKGIGYRFNS